MLIVSFVSGSGGSGKSSLIGNIANLLSSRESPVIALDLDPANRLGLHLFIQDRLDEAHSPISLKDDHWEQYKTNFYGVRFQSLGYGHECRLFMDYLEKTPPSKFREQIISAHPERRSLVLVDTSKSPSFSANLGMAISDLVVAVITPHPGVMEDIRVINASYAHARTNASANAGSELVFLWNLIDSRSELSCDIINIVKQTTGISILPYAIHRDENYREAIAKKLPLNTYAYNSQSNRDVVALSLFLKSKVLSTT